MRDGFIKLVKDITRLREDPKIRALVNQRIEEFRRVGRGDWKEIFKELAFCILTANFNAVGGIKIQKEIDDGFIEWDEQKLATELKRLGHRYPRTRARYIVLSRKFARSLPDLIDSMRESPKRLREWLAKNIKGLGFKEASHFLRNIGILDLAIIDFHIIDLLARYKILAKPKSLTKKRYLEIESLLSQLARATNMSLGELDLYLWYLETGKILK